MSTNRSSSGVRTLRAMFEESSSTDMQDQATNGRVPSTDGEARRPKVRSSFVAVEPSGNAFEIDPDTSKAANGKRSSTASLRRASFSLDQADDRGALETLKKTVSDEREARRESTIIPETVPEIAVETTPLAGTPVVEAKEDLAAGKIDHGGTYGDAQIEEASNKLEALEIGASSMPPANPDKPVSAVEEDPGEMKSADPKDKATVSESNEAAGAIAGNSPVAENRKASSDKSEASTVKTTAKQGTPSKSGSTAATTPSKSTPSQTTRTAQRPSNIFTSRTPKLSSPSSKLKTPSTSSRPTTSDSKNSATPSKKPTSPKDMLRRASRSSLTASTASSAAKAKPQVAETVRTPQADRESKPSPAAKSLHKLPTRVAELSSRLTAPTASSAAKHEEASKSAKPAAAAPSKPSGRHSMRASTNGSLSATAGTKSTLARSNSTAARPSSSRLNASKPVKADESFLSRMTRPTASTASKAHEKVEAKSPPRRARSILRQRPNGHAKSRPTRTEKPVSSATPADNGAAKILRGTGSSEASPQHQETSTTTELATSTPESKEGSSTNGVLADTPALETATIR